MRKVAQRGKHGAGRLAAAAVLIALGAPACERSAAPAAAAPAETAPANAARATAQPAVSTYASVVAPILASRCTGCHGAERQKGGLALHLPGSILAGGRGGAVLVPGRPEQSELARRVSLPATDEDHMPPEGKPPLGGAEIAALSAWIAAGADFGPAGPAAPAAGPPGPPPAPGDDRGAAHASAPGRLAGVAAADGVGAADPALLAALRDARVHVESVSPGATGLRVDFGVLGSAANDDLVARLLQELLPWVEDLALPRTAVGDATLALCARMPALRRLDLLGTRITERGLVALAGHTGLERLILVDTALADGAVETLAALPALRRLHLWRAGLGSAALAELRQRRPALHVDAGDQGDAEVLEQEPPWSPGAAEPAQAWDRSDDQPR